MKGQVLHRLRTHLKVPGKSSDLSTLLTRKFRAMFLSRLNEINEGCEKILPVFHSGRNTMMQALTVIKQKRPSD